MFSPLHRGADPGHVVTSPLEITMRSNTSTLLRAVHHSASARRRIGIRRNGNAAVSVAWTCKGTLGPFSQISNMTTSVPAPRRPQ